MAITLEINTNLFLSLWKMLYHFSPISFVDNTTDNISDNDSYKYVEEFLDLNLYFWNINF